MFLPSFFTKYYICQWSWRVFLLSVTGILWLKMIREKELHSHISGLTWKREMKYFTGKSGHFSIADQLSSLLDILTSKKVFIGFSQWAIHSSACDGFDFAKALSSVHIFKKRGQVSSRSSLAQCCFKAHLWSLVAHLSHPPLPVYFFNIK